MVVGLGPGPAEWMTPEASTAIKAATDVVGYGPYVERLALRANQRAHSSDNRVEMDRARLALKLAAEGRIVAVVSGGDPGVFAMAAAVFEAIEDDPQWLKLDIAVAPGVTAMHAAAARLGAPLGHDFCAISLSDNLKPWAIVERRLRAAAEGDFVIALYNPASKARPTRITQAFDLLRTVKTTTTPVAFARAVGRADEKLDSHDAWRSGRKSRRHGDAGRHRFERDALHSARRRAAMDADATRLWGSSMIGDPGQDRVEVVTRFGFGSRGPAHDDHLDLKRARRLDLGVGRAPAAVLGHQGFHALVAHKRDFVGQREGSARKDQLAAGQGVDLRGPVDRPHDVAMLGGSREGGELQATLRKEDCSRGGPKSVDGLLDCRDLDPAVARFARPRRPAEDDERGMGRAAGGDRVGRDARSERMGGVNNGVDALAGEKRRQASGAAKAAYASRDWRRSRFGRRPRKRQDCRNVGLIGDPPRKHAGFRRPAENEQAKALQWAAP